MTLRSFVPVLLLAVVFSGPVQAFDEGVKDWALAHRTATLDPVMRFASDRARLVLFGGTALGLCTATGRLVMAEAVGVLVPVNLVVEVLKYAVDRVRPDGSHRRVNSSFPSSHTANAFAFALVLARRFRRGAWAFLGSAALVGYSRIYLDRHWASDVLVGAAIGVALAWWCGAWIRERWLVRMLPTT